MAETEGSSVQQRVERSRDGRGCVVCAKLAFLPRDMICSIGADHADLFGVDVGLHELMSRINALEAEGARLDARTAEKVAERITQQGQRIRKDMIRAGILQSESQSFTGEYCRARMMAPFDLDEIRIGAMIGTGGFSSAFIIEGFQLKSAVSSEMNEWQQASRTYLTQHAQIPLEFLPGTAKKMSASATTARYALKHLRQALTKEPDRFERAAMDLNLEALLLLCMDHPNIISIRGWTRGGPQAYRNGKHSDFFLVLDRLPETLEDRLLVWRTKLRKYRSRYNMPWGKPKYGPKLDKLFLEQIKAAYDAAAAIEYMHDRRIINRDIKSSNIGFDVHGDLKIFDFGLSRLLPTTGRVRDGYAMSRVGTKYYMAPEVRRKEPYNLAADVYSFGVVLWEIFALATPREVLKRIRNDRRISKDDVIASMLPVCNVCWSSTIRHLVPGCLAPIPSERLSMTEVRSMLQHELNDLGMKQNGRHRRRSTLRVDISQMEFSLDRTSHTSSAVESAEISALEASVDRIQEKC